MKKLDPKSMCAGAGLLAQTDRAKAVEREQRARQLAQDAVERASAAERAIAVNAAHRVAQRLLWAFAVGR